MFVRLLIPDGGFHILNSQKQILILTNLAMKIFCFASIAALAIQLGVERSRWTTNGRLCALAML